MATCPRGSRSRPPRREPALFFSSPTPNSVAAHWSKVGSTRLRTEIVDGAARVSTIEHLMAALAGMGVDNALVELDAGEVPAMDGSAAPFVEAIWAAGVRRLDAARRVIKVVEPVRVSDGAGWAELLPTHTPGSTLTSRSSFPGAAGRQRHGLALDVANFRAGNRPGPQLRLRERRRATVAAGAGARRLAR